MTAADAATTCPRVEPDSCPSPAPSFSGSVNAIIQDRCAVCHSPNGAQPVPTFTDYTSIYAQRSAMLDQASSCLMPPAGAADLTLSERVALLGWLVCGAPMN